MEDKNVDNSNEIVIDLMNNKEVLDARKKEIESIQKTIKMYEDFQKDMIQDKAEIVEDVEKDFGKSERNAKQEIMKEKEYQDEFREKKICIVYLIGGVFLTVLGIVLGVTVD